MSKKGEPREPLWTDAEIGYLRENYTRMPCASIAAHLGRSYESVRRKAAKVGVQHQEWGVHFTPEEDAILIARYATSPMSELVALMGRHPNSIRHRAKMLGLVNEEQVKRREMAAGMRHDYFGRIDSPVKAYLLGILGTDGNVGSSGNAIKLQISPKDIEIAELMREEISPYARILRYVNPPLPGYTKERHVACLVVSSAQMKADLGRLGVIPRKTFALVWPDLDEELTASYLLGCYDGDGSICTDKQGPIWDLYSASPDFLLAAHDAILRHTGMELPRPRISRGRTYVLRLTGKRVAVLDRWLHADLPGLARKRLAA